MKGESLAGHDIFIMHYVPNGISITDLKEPFKFLLLLSSTRAKIILLLLIVPIR